MKDDQYICEACGGTFTKDQDAGARMKKTTGDILPWERTIVCDACYSRMGFDATESAPIDSADPSRKPDS